MTAKKYSNEHSPQSRQEWRYAYLFFYTVGGCFSLLTLLMLGWMAYCIAIEAEPLSFLSFLPPMPTAAAFVIIFSIMFIACASWQIGAHFHQKFEKES